MQPRSARWLAGGLVSLYAVLATTGLILQVVTQISFADLGIPVPLLVVFFLGLGVWPLTGALIVWRYPRHPVGWLWCVGIPAAAADQFASGYASLDAALSPGSLPGVDAALVWLNLSGMPFGVAIFTIILLIFPAGRFTAPRWQAVAWAAAMALLVYVPLKAFEPGPLAIYRSRDNPVAVSPSAWNVLAPVQWAAISALTLCFTAAVVYMFIRLRRARGDERQQIKWLVFPATLFGLGIPLVVLGEYESTGAVFGLGGVMHMLAVVGMVVATAIAIFKYHLYGIDIIINKALVYGALSGSLALVYFCGVVLLRQVFRTDSQISVVLSTLAIAGLFAPLRRRIQDVIDRRFYRRKYDARLALAQFSARTRDEVEMERLSEALLGVVDETLQPAHVGLWLKPRARRTQ